MCVTFKIQSRVLPIKGSTYSLFDISPVEIAMCSACVHFIEYKKQMCFVCREQEHVYHYVSFKIKLCVMLLYMFWDWELINILTNSCQSKC